MAITDEELDLTGVLGLDFVNTVVRTRAGRVDFLETPAWFLDWMGRVEEAHSEASVESPTPAHLPDLRRFTIRDLAPADLPGLRLLTVEARELRCGLVALFRWMSDSAEAAPSGGARGLGRSRALDRSRGIDRSADFDAAAAFTIDRALRAAPATYQLVGVRVRTRFEVTGPLAALTPIALSAVEVVHVADPARLRECDADGCVRWFVDTSKGGRRRWCSMARCGNRAKAARYRRRHADEE